MTKTVDEYIAKQLKWAEALTQLRALVTSSAVKETVKWGMPVYTVDGKNVVGIGAFKEHFGIWFFQGVFLKDPKKVLVNAQEGSTKAMRQWRFSSIEELEKNAETVLTYVEEAIKNQKQGKEIKPARKPNLSLTKDMEKAFENEQVIPLFNKLSEAKKREYIEYVTEAKRTETRDKRLSKIIPMIKEGLGLNDQYK